MIDRAAVSFSSAWIERTSASVSSSVRKRLRCTSGPAVSRSYRWSLWALPTLVREQQLCPPDERQMVAEATRARARLTLADAVHVRIKGGDLDRRDLATIYELAPRTPKILGLRTALALPRPLDRLALIAARRTRNGIRRLTRAGAPAPAPPTLAAPQPQREHAVATR